ncbi:transposase Tn5 dimerization domain protein [Vibrio cholerae]|nr:transposase Tn5 dimerization domain protein [Vibrio cholerae]
MPPVTLKSPANKKEFNNIPLYYVGCIEQGESNDKLAWHLLTSEPVTSREEALKIVSYYELRWLIEDFHKVWKSEGTQVEQLRMQSKDNLERLSVILAFIATRLLQLRFMNESDELSKSSCEPIFRLGGWKNTKRTGRASIKTLWQGWFRLQTILEGYELAKSLDSLDL